MSEPAAESGWERELRERLRAIFADEAAERLVALDAALLALERGTTGDDAVHHLTEAFRQAHTLKGGARAAGLPDMERVAHRLESAFDQLRSGGGAGPGGWDAIYAAVDGLRALLAGRAADVDAVVAALDAAGATPDGPVPGRDAGEAAHRRAVPPRPPPPGARRAPDPGAGGEAVRVPVARLERLMADVRELHAGLSSLRLRATEARRLDQRTSRLGRTLRRYRLRPAAGPPRPSGATPPDDGLGLIEEMGDLRRHLDADVRRLEQVTADLHADVRRLRMVPVGVALAGLPRLLRDTAAACGKEARLELVGDDTEVDRSVLEGISGAVTHLVRNAVDHGLERRAAAGKPPVGVVTVAAREGRGTLLLEVSDDGAGIDVAAVDRRAGELGLVAAGDPAPGLDILFRAGFSTAERLTEVSGRGVGLDAVAAMVGARQGSVAVRTVPGQGTTFTITLPLTLATTRSLLLRAGGRTLALPMAAVERVVRTGHGPTRPGADDSVPVADLAAVIGFAGDAGDAAGPDGRGPAPAPGRLAIVAAGATDRAAVVVDAVLGEEELVVSTLPPPLRHVRFTAGAAILGTGEVVPVLHAAEVFRAAALPRGAVVVVADDSAAARSLARAALESAGFAVRPAADGAEALALVEAGGCAAVVSDVQMPGLDGVTLCRRLRADARFRHLPVVLMTSLASPADRREGLAAGADAYLVKGRSDHGLVATLRGLL